MNTAAWRATVHAFAELDTTDQSSMQAHRTACSTTDNESDEAHVRINCQTARNRWGKKKIKVKRC